MVQEKNIQMAFGNAVRKQRMIAGFSQERLGELSGIHRTYVGDVERGERNPAIVNMQRLASALGVKLSDLIVLMEESLTT